MDGEVISRLSEATGTTEEEVMERIIGLEAAIQLREQVRRAGKLYDSPAWAGNISTQRRPRRI